MVIPAMLPVPTVPASAVLIAWKGSNFAFFCFPFLKILPMVFFMA